ncbi:MAG: uroporphyrinogen-III synthase [Cyanobacteria bacterium P01_H01_bin.121]
MLALTTDAPLRDMTILVTRATGQAAAFTTLLEQQGATVLEMPTLAIVPPSDWGPLDHAIAQLDTMDWLILTSANAVTFFWQRLQHQTQKVQLPPDLKLAVVGKKTAATLKQFGYQADFIPPDFVADSLIDTFPDALADQQILFPRVETGGRTILIDAFRQAGAVVHEVPAYESGCPEAIPQAIQAAIAAHSIQIVTFASAKTVVNFQRLLAQTWPHDWQNLLDPLAIASIGPQTSIACREKLGRVDLEATQYTLDGLTAALVTWVNQTR